MILLHGIGARPAPAVVTPPPRTMPVDYIGLNGREVFKFAVTRVRQLVRGGAAELAN